jgi:pimeloyl-ACP methyl ester carboxylesterase
MGLALARGAGHGILAAMSRLASYRVGSGDHHTVLLHGFLGSGKNVRSLAQRWVERDPARTILVPDLTGHGASPGLPPFPPGATLATLAGDVLETARQQGMTGPLSILGHSLGGRVGLAAAREAPEDVPEVILLDIAPGPVDERHSAGRVVLDLLLAAPDEAPSRRAMRQHFIDGGLSPETADWVVMNVRVDGDRARWIIDRPALEHLQETTNAEDLWEVVEGRREGFRCIRGGRSRYVQDDDATRLQAAGCPVVTLPDAGHDLHVEALAPLLAVLVG